jgi:biotin-(acetyl-CoA carboxylase) ligase
MASFLFRGVSTELDSLFSMKVGFALLQVLNRHYQKLSLVSPLVLKWPNDLLKVEEGRFFKVGGILTQLEQLDSEIQAFVGIGVNLTVSPPISGVQVSSLQELSWNSDQEARIDLCREIRDEIQNTLTLENFLEHYQLAHFVKPGAFVEWLEDRETHRGIFESFNVDGSFCVLESGKLRSLYSEELQLKITIESDLRAF